MPTLEIVEHSPDWHAIRQKNIGGSEIAALFRRQADYQMSEFTLHMVKSGRIPPPPVEDGPGSRIWFGTKLEAVIGAMAAELYGWKIRKGGYCTDDIVAGMACSLDYVITEPGPREIELGFEGPGVLQLKNIDMIQHKRSWTPAAIDALPEPPEHIVWQLQHEIACTGYTWGAIVGMVGGNQLPAYRYPARPVVIDAIRERVARFWTRVRDGILPLVDGSDSTADALDVLFPPLPGDEAVDLTADNELPQICAGLIVATADRKQATDNENELKNRLAEKMRGHKRAIATGYAINGVFTAANLGERAGDMPPDKIVGARKASCWYRPKELLGMPS